jgi:hypothetical protein
VDLLLAQVLDEAVRVAAVAPLERRRAEPFALERVADPLQVGAARPGSVQAPVLLRAPSERGAMRALGRDARKGLRLQALLEFLRGLAQALLGLGRLPGDGGDGVRTPGAPLEAFSCG